MSKYFLRGFFVIGKCAVLCSHLVYSYPLVSLLTFVNAQPKQKQKKTFRMIKTRDMMKLNGFIILYYLYLGANNTMFSYPKEKDGKMRVRMA